MRIADGLSRMVAFLRNRYPTPMPATGHVAAFALLPRRVSDDEINAITSELITTHGRRTIGSADLGAEILRVTDEMPSLEDIERAQRGLDANRP